MTKCRKYREINQIDQDTFKLYNEWYHVAVREMVNLKNFDESPKWLAANVFPRITEKQASDALELLLTLETRETRRTR